jgi:hypothetical protein
MADQPDILAMRHHGQGQRNERVGGRRLSQRAVLHTPSLSLDLRRRLMRERLRPYALKARAPRCEGPRSDIQHADNGLLIAPQDPAETAAALTHLLLDSDFALNLARNGQATFKAKFGDGGGEILLQALHRLILKSPKRKGE